MKMNHMLLCSVLALVSWQAPANECPSMLGQALKPVEDDSSFRWAAEMTLKAGRTTGGGDSKKNFNNEMLLLGLEYRVSPVFMMYVEGGFKYWNKTGPQGGGGGDAADARQGQNRGAETSANNQGTCPAVEGNWSSKSYAGFREVYAEYTPASSVVRGGLQSMTAGDLLLLDERVLGLLAAHDTANLRLQAGLGTVSYKFARNGEFCASRHNYRALYPYWQRELSDELGENNLAFMALSWFPGRAQSPGGQDEFESWDSPATPFWKVNEVGAVFLQQFGDGFSNDSSYVAGFIKNTGPFDIHLDLELVGQWAEGENCLGYWAAAEKSLGLGAAGTSILRGGYLGVSGKTDETRFAPAFDNLNLGEAIHMDAVDAPLYFGEIQHTVPCAWPVTMGCCIWRKRRMKKPGKWISMPPSDRASRPCRNINGYPIILWWVWFSAMWMPTTLRNRFKHGARNYAGPCSGSVESMVAMSAQRANIR